MEFEEDRNNLHAVINGTDNKQADLSSEYIKFILMNSSIDAGGSTKLGEGFLALFMKAEILCFVPCLL